MTRIPPTDSVSRAARLSAGGAACALEHGLPHWQSQDWRPARTRERVAMSDTFLQRPASSLHDDGSRYSQFLAAFEDATRIPQDAIRTSLDQASNASVGDVIETMIPSYPNLNGLGLDEVMKLVRDVGDELIRQKMDWSEPMGKELADWRAYVA